MQPQSLATLGIVIAALGLIAWWLFAHRHELRRRHLDEVPDDLARKIPPSLHPEIDPAICIGSAACVSACPEGDILGLHRGRAMLVEPTACIGHGECAAECPVGAIKLVFGSSERGVDIPHLTGNFETNVPGLFIVGELGGMGLIRNAVTQGREAVDYIAKLDRSRDEGVLDLVVVGAGPAGMAATLNATKHGLRCVAIDQESIGGTINHYPRRKIVMLAPVEIPMYGKLKVRQMLKEELVDVWNRAIADAQVDIRPGTKMTDIRREGDVLVVSSASGELRARRVILAIGRRGSPRKLGVPGEHLDKVAYSLKEADEFEGLRVLVVGGGDSAIEAAVALAEVPGTTVHLAYRGTDLVRAKPRNIEALESATETRRVGLLLSSNVREIREESVLLDCNGEALTLDNDYVFIFAGGEVPTALLTRLGISLERKFGTV